ncbi:MAG: hypothetical protein FWF75_10535 [Propionibacteriaceae bacterium]|nr:hypothetical protein [Propionibacteriaceae bacterium]
MGATISGTFITVSLMLGLTGCEGVTNWRMFSRGDAVLPSGTVFAVYMSRQTHDNRMNGYVLLVQRDGAISAVQTAGMDVNDLVWDEQAKHGL